MNAAEFSKALQIRKALKKRKPRFLRSGAGLVKRVSKIWRRPSGLQTKIRLGRKSHRANVSPGWGSPNIVKGLHPSGLKEVLVANREQLAAVNPKSEGAVLVGTTGMKRRLELIKAAQQLNVTILNLNTKKFLENAEEQLKVRRERKKAKVAPKKVEPKKEEKKEPKQEEKPLTDEEKKELEKKEKDKILTRREL